MKSPRSLLRFALLWVLTASVASSPASYGADGEAQRGLTGPVLVTGRVEKTVSFGDAPRIVRVQFTFRTDGRLWALTAGRDGFRRNFSREYAYDGDVLRELNFGPGGETTVDESSVRGTTVMGRVTRSSVPPEDTVQSRIVWFALLGSGMPMADLPEGFGCWILGVNQTNNPCRYEVTAVEAGTPQVARQWEISGRGWTAVHGNDGPTYVPIRGDAPHLHVDARMMARFGRWGDRIPERFMVEVFDPVTRAAAPAAVVEVVIENVVADDSGAPFVPMLPPVETKVFDEVHNIEYSTLGAWVEPGSEAYDFARRMNASVDVANSPGSAPRSRQTSLEFYVLCAIAVTGAVAVTWARARG